MRGGGGALIDQMHATGEGEPLIENRSIYTPAGTKGLRESVGEVEKKRKGKGGGTQSNDRRVKKDMPGRHWPRPTGNAFPKQHGYPLPCVCRCRGLQGGVFETKITTC